MNARLVFFGSLRELLTPPHREHGVVDYAVRRRASVKDVIEALGPPHTEVGRILVNGEEAGFDHIIEPRQGVEIHPVSAPFDVFSATRLRPDPLATLTFLVDANVGRLATLLRLLGFDAAFDRRWDDAELAAMAETEGRVLLSKDHRLLKRRQIVYGRLIRSAMPWDQLAEALHFFGLTPPYAPFSRCLRCNVVLEPTDKARVLDRLLPLTRRYYENFHICPCCGRIYWRGSHHAAMLARVEELAPLPRDG